MTKHGVFKDQSCVAAEEGSWVGAGAEWDIPRNNEKCVFKLPHEKLFWGGTCFSVNI